MRCSPLPRGKRRLTGRAGPCVHSQIPISRCTAGAGLRHPREEPAIKYYYIILIPELWLRLNRSSWQFLLGCRCQGSVSQRTLFLALLTERWWRWCEFFAVCVFLGWLRKGRACVVGTFYTGVRLPRWNTLGRKKILDCEVNSGWGCAVHVQGGQKSDSRAGS